MCTAFGKQWHEFAKLARTTAFMAALGQREAGVSSLFQHTYFSESRNMETAG